MKSFTIILPLLVIILFQSCANLEFAGDSKQLESAPDSHLTTKSSAVLYYHEDTGFLIQKQEDPFIAKNGNEITHRAIEYRPKNMDEYNILMHYSDSVFFSYIPFGFSPVRELAANERGQYEPFPTEERYYISQFRFDNDSLRKEEGSNTLPKESKLPYLYAVWPVNMAIPEHIAHIERYDVCLPLKTGNKKEPSRFEGTGQIYLPITVNTYDSFLGSYIPMTGIKVRVTNGSFYCDYTMNSSGSATIQPLMFNIELTLFEIAQLQVYVIYQTPKFTVSRDNAVIPIQRYLGTVSSLWGSMAYNTTYPTYVSHQSSETNECDVFQGACYYFYGTHDYSSLITSSEQGGIVLHSSTSQPSNCRSEVTIDSLANLTIYVYNNFNNSNTECIASTIHELGHIHHSYINYNCSSIQIMVRESFASYIGWLLGETYYLSKGYVRPFPGLTINMQDRQWWTPYSPLFIDDPDLYYYTPLFIDLTDDYNQGCITDTISGVPASVIDAMMETCTTVSACKSYLLSYVGTYYTSPEINAYLAYYPN